MVQYYTIKDDRSHLCPGRGTDILNMEQKLPNVYTTRIGRSLGLVYKAGTCMVLKGVVKNLGRPTPGCRDRRPNQVKRDIFDLRLPHIRPHQDRRRSAPLARPFSMASPLIQNLVYSIDTYSQVGH